MLFLQEETEGTYIVRPLVVSVASCEKETFERP